MDRSIPQPAAIILEFIYRTETGRNPPDCYHTIYGHNEDQLPAAITDMTLAEIQRKQGGWSKRFGSSATGAYQFMRATLKDLIRTMDLDTSLQLTPGLQDRLGFQLLIRRRYHDFIEGRIDEVAFARQLAMEWASLPVLVDSKGNTRMLHAGQSYYAGDGLNKALVSTAQVCAVLKRAKALATFPGQRPVSANVKKVVEDADKPMRKSTTAIATGATAVAGASAAAKEVVQNTGSIMEAGPWVLVLVLILGGAGYVLWERRRKARNARDAKRSLA